MAQSFTGRVVCICICIPDIQLLLPGGRSQTFLLCCAATCCAVVCCAVQGCWQPPEQFEAGGRFSPVAAAVRAAKAAGSHRGPLDGKLIHIQCQANPTAAAATAKAASTHAAAAGEGPDAAAASGGALVAFSSHTAAADHRQSLQRLVRALGGRVCGPRAAEVCVVCAGAAVPRELPAAAAAVREEWLLSVAETHSGAEQTGQWEVKRRQQQQQQ